MADPDATAADGAAAVGPSGVAPELLTDLVDELEAAGLRAARLVGRGGFGAVYRCFQTALDRTVAVKVLTDDLDLESRERFLREEHAMGRLSGHPNIVDILQVDLTGTGRPYIVMPYHARGSLDAVVHRTGPLDWADVVHVGIKLAGAVESAHWMGILHRDVKPANVLLTAYDEPQLTDFGIARVRGGFETGTRSVVGSPAFIAPEVLSGRPPTEQSDVYGLGATLFALLTGHAAFERRTGEKVVAQFLRITSESVPDLRRHDIPDDLSAAIEAAMVTDPAERPPGAAEFGEILQRVARRHELPQERMALPADVSTKQTRRRASGPDAERSGPIRDRTPARPRSGELIRQRLLDLLESARHERVTILDAPAGYGKTTVAMQWRDRLDRAGETTTWWPASANETPPIYAATHRNGTLFVDDAHMLRSTELDRMITRAESNHGPSLVLAGRDPLPQSGGGLTRIRADELVLDGAEARQLFLDVHGLRLADAEVADLCSAAAGWVTALQLVALSLRGGTISERAPHTRVVAGTAARAARLIRRSAGDREAVAKALLDNLLNTVEPRMAEFLMAVSTIERIDSASVRTIVDDPQATTLLREAERSNLLLQHASDDRSLRLPPLIGELLRKRIAHRDPPAAEFTNPSSRDPRRGSVW